MSSDDSQAITALNPEQFGNLNNNAPVCGKTITISHGGTEVQATIVDQGGVGFGGLDLAQNVFEHLMVRNIPGLSLYSMALADPDSPSQPVDSMSSGGLTITIPVPPDPARVLPQAAPLPPLKAHHRLPPLVLEEVQKLRLPNRHLLLRAARKMPATLVQDLQTLK